MSETLDYLFEKVKKRRERSEVEAVELTRKELERKKPEVETIKSK